jgi:aryl-alcohol dehydrogenase-like predicted oxidoreductase
LRHRAEDAAAQAGANQPLYNLYRRDIEAAVVPTSLRLGLGQLVYSPLAQGVLTGKYAPGKPPPTGTRATEAAGKRFVEVYLTEARLLQAQQLKALAERHSLTATQVALAFCLANPGVSSVLVGARVERQLQQSVAAVDVVLSNAVTSELERIFPA